MTNNPLLQKYEELHNPKPSKTVSGYPHLRPDEHRLVQILKGMIQDIRDGKVFLNNYEEEKEDYAMKMNLDFSNRINRGRMINIRVFKKYD